MKNQHREFDLILVSGETSPVRRFRLSRERIRNALIGAAALVLTLSFLTVDYIRLRLDAVDVEVLRAQTQEFGLDLDQRCLADQHVQPALIVRLRAAAAVSSRWRL